jgi:EAL domain-containing protein (putative c-di-GMP-specific phosphodiesterase class I)
VVFCENSGLDDARIIATGIVESFQEPFLLNGKPFRCATSIGLAPANSRGLDSIADILHAADSAMYSAKRRGGNQFVVFENPLHDKLLRQIQLEQDLFQSIERSEISVHYQALVAVENQRLIGFEALLRWKHPVYGHISPGEFIPMAEYTGHIQALGAWVLRDALRQVGRWRLLFNSELFVAVNVSIQQLGNHNFAQIVSAALDEANLPSAALHLEVTESMLMQSATESQLEAIEALGVKIAIDDFGTGYSSLSYLPRLAVSEVKLDRTFLDGVGVDRRKTALFGAIIAMAHTLNLVVVAEGIEEVSQLKCIREHRCDSAQGYLLSKPLAPETVERMLVEEWQEGFVYPALV